MKDYILAWIERTANRLSNWTWDKRFKARDPNEWIKGFRKWKEGK